MAYFLRYTTTANEDLNRNHSFHASSLELNWSREEMTEEEEKESMAKSFGCDVEDVVLLDIGQWNNGVDNGNMCYFQKLEGLCGFELEAETLEEAIEEAKEFGFNEVYNSESMGDIITIFQGEYIDENLEGCLFDAEKIVYNG